MATRFLMIGLTVLGKSLFWHFKMKHCWLDRPEQHQWSCSGWLCYGVFRLC